MFRAKRQSASSCHSQDDNAIRQALDKVQAVIWFDLKGNVLDANDNFCTTLGYGLDEIKGQHHRKFVESDYANSPEYRAFWEKLGRGEPHTGEFKRIKKDGRIVWFKASYNPVLDDAGNPVKVVKFAIDITDQKNKAADAMGQLQAISASQAVIEFKLDGTILRANQNFLDTVGYNLNEIKGQHHRMFCDPNDVASDASAAYQALWKSLADGNFRSEEFKRIAKDKSEVWIQASYNPILDPNGRVHKVVKYATNVTPRKQAMTALVDGLGALASGDLTARVPASVGGEFAAPRDAFNATLDRLSELVSGILEAANAIAAETDSIAANATDLATRGERQAASLEETAAAMDQISSTVKSSAANARAATEVAASASHNAKKGGQVVADAVDAMTKIEDSTSEIGKIVEVIDGIAFQTNLLALNAGVEAARAGEAGRGFAVVASEVRALAHRSSDSAKEINDLISRSNIEVSEGSRLVSDSGTALKEIVTDVNAVAENISDIMNASQEQSTAIAEVTQAMSQVDRATQQNAALAEESSAAGMQLADRAASLRELVSFFDQGAGGHRSASSQMRGAA